MKRWIARAAGLYPRSWREEYGAEFDALLDDVKPGWRAFANVLGGAMKMHLTTGTNWLKLVAATAAVAQSWLRERALRWRRVTYPRRRSASLPSPIHCGPRLRRHSGNERLSTILRRWNRRS